MSPKKGSIKTLSDKKTSVKIVAFDREYQDWGIFSNYADTPIKMSTPFGERTFPTVEHYFQYQKNPTDKNYLDAILKGDAANARSLGKQQTWIKIDGQGFGRADKAMLDAIQAKIAQHPDVAKALQDTGDACLIEDTGSRSRENQDGNWGWKTGGTIDEHRGAGNKLGILLMQERARLQKKSTDIAPLQAISEQARQIMHTKYPNENLISLCNQNRLPDATTSSAAANVSSPHQRQPILAQSLLSSSLLAPSNSVVTPQVEFKQDNALNPDSGDYIVCAGTVNLNQVANMGSGFNLFKTQFGYNDTPTPDWVNELQRKLNAFKTGTGSCTMPAFQAVTYNGKSGGVATVPCMHQDGRVAIACDPNKTADEQYKDAIRGAITGARAAGKALYIQPLGIGVYGWSPQRAANLFADVIEEDKKANPTNPLKIKIPIFNVKENSNDLLFQHTLEQRIQDSAHLKSKSVTPRTPASPSIPETTTQASIKHMSNTPPKQSTNAIFNPPPSLFRGYDRVDGAYKVTELQHFLLNKHECPTVLDTYLQNNTNTTNQVVASKVLIECSVKNVMQTLAIDASLTIVHNNQKGTAVSGKTHDDCAMKVTFKTHEDAVKFTTALYHQHGIHSHTFGQGYMKTPQGLSVYLTKEDLNKIAKSSEISQLKEPGNLAYDAIKSQFISSNPTEAKSDAHEPRIPKI